MCDAQVVAMSFVQKLSLNATGMASSCREEFFPVNKKCNTFQFTVFLKIIIVIIIKRFIMRSRSK
jgi:hypothetical protein